MSAAARALVEQYYLRLYGGEETAAMEACLADDYIEHQYTADFSRAGLCAYIARRRRNHPAHRVTIHHSLSDGDLVFLYVQETLSAEVDYARAELFRIASGYIAEHWGAEVLDDRNRKNANGTFDGARVDRTRDFAQRFGARFEELDRRGFDGQELDVFGISRSSDYRQHSPKGGDGRHGLVEILGKAKAAGIKVTMRRYRTLCDGDLLVSHRLYDTHPAHPLMNRIYTFDVFRLDETGRAVEHWDVMDPVPAPELLPRME